MPNHQGSPEEMRHLVPIFDDNRDEFAYIPFGKVFSACHNLQINPQKPLLGGLFAQ